MMHSTFETTVYEPQGGPATGTIIWMHGLGAYAREFFNLESRLDLPADLFLRFIFPQAPDRPITVNHHLMMPAWYDIPSLQVTMDEDEEGIVASQKILNTMIDQEREKGIPSERIFLGGFSQGAAMALFTGLRYPERIGGIIALSTYLPKLSSTEYEMKPANRTTPIFMAHGDYDDVLPKALAMRTYNTLYELGLPITWKSYQMQHQVRIEELADVGAFLSTHLTS